MSLVQRAFGAGRGPSRWPARWTAHTTAARADGRLIGLAMTRPCDIASDGALRPGAWLSHVCVDPPERDRGVGAAIVVAALRAARARGAEIVATCAARPKLYVQAGFAPRGHLWRCDGAWAGRESASALECEIRRERAEDAAAVDDFFARIARTRDHVVVIPAAERARFARGARQAWIARADGRVVARCVVGIAHAAPLHGLVLHAFVAEDEHARDALIAVLRARSDAQGFVRARWSPADDEVALLSADATRFTRGEAWLCAEFAPSPAAPARAGRLSRPTRFGA